jgi:hypothetical protein
MFWESVNVCLLRCQGAMRHGSAKMVRPLLTANQVQAWACPPYMQLLQDAEVVHVMQGRALRHPLTFFCR